MSVANVSSLASVQESLKGASVQELLALINSAAAEAKKKAKGVKEPKSKEKKEPKEKGPVPPQLRIPHAWVAETLRDAKANGWEEFQVAGGDVMPASALIVDGEHLFENGKTMNHKLAMSLSKQRWAPKTQIGTHKEMYEEFLLAFQASDAAITAALAEPEEEPEPAPKAAVAATKAVPKASAVPAPLKAAKAAAAHAPLKAAVVAAPLKVATPPKAAAAAAPLKVATPPKAAAAAAKPATPPKKTKANTWTCEDDGNVHEWEYKGKKYARNFQNHVWEYENGEVGSWAGVFDGKKIDASAEEPLYMEDE
jgi:hypothetical protein